MSKRIVTEIGGDYKGIRNAASNEGTNWDLMRVYNEPPVHTYAVIISDDNLFEGL